MIRIFPAIAVWVASLGLTWSAATAGQPDEAAAGKEDGRQGGEKRDIVVYANPEEYASFPQIVRTDQEVVLLFQVQNLAALRDSGQHPHYQRLAAPRWAASRDGGVTWEIHETCPPLGPVRDIGYGSVARGDGATVTLTFSATEPLRAIVQRGSIGYRPYGDAGAEVGERHAITDLGPFPRFHPHGMTRLADGTLLAGGYAAFEGKRGWGTVLFLASTDEGRSWGYRGRVPNPFFTDSAGQATVFEFSEPVVMEARDGRLMALLRADHCHVPADRHRPEVGGGGRTGAYGYFLYRSESTDGGRTWSEAERLPLWGHPPYMLRLASGNLLLVYGYRRAPWEIRAILSRDEGRTWDMDTLRTVHRFEPGNLDMGYPVATQLDDGSIVCAFYGYFTDQVEHYMGPSAGAKGIFASIFDERWLTGERED